MSMSQAENVRKVDIIWNSTLVCPWDCENCCVDAIHVLQKGGKILIRSESLTQIETIDFNQGHGSRYDQAASHRQKLGLELTFEQKIQVLDNLKGVQPRIDFSGGDPLSISETLRVMREAALRFGKKQITLTATGAGLVRCDPEEIVPLIGELNFTYDNISKGGDLIRPAGYANGNLLKAAQFAKAGVNTRAECPLSAQNADEKILRRLYRDLHEANIDKLLLMRLFPVGRGVYVEDEVLSPAGYRGAIAVIRDMEEKLGYPKVKLQCALKFFESKNHRENPCDLFRESFGLMANGTLLASSWAINSHGKPLNKEWILGNLATTPMTEILASKKAKAFEQRLDENFGHCKIFSFLNSAREDTFDRIFDTADPLYMQNEGVTINTQSSDVARSKRPTKAPISKEAGFERKPSAI